MFVPPPLCVKILCEKYFGPGGDKKEATDWLADSHWARYHSQALWNNIQNSITIGFMSFYLNHQTNGILYRMLWNKHDTRAGVAELVLGDVHVRAVDYYFTLFYFILFYFILFCFVLFYFIIWSVFTCHVLYFHVIILK